MHIIQPGSIHENLQMQTHGEDKGLTSFLYATSSVPWTRITRSMFSSSLDVGTVHPSSTPIASVLAVKAIDVLNLLTMEPLSMELQYSLCLVARRMHSTLFSLSDVSTAIVAAVRLELCFLVDLLSVRGMFIKSTGTDPRGFFCFLCDSLSSSVPCDPLLLVHTWNGVVARLLTAGYMWIFCLVGEIHIPLEIRIWDLIPVTD